MGRQRSASSHRSICRPYLKLFRVIVPSSDEPIVHIALCSLLADAASWPQLLADSIDIISLVVGYTTANPRLKDPIRPRRQRQTDLIWNGIVKQSGMQPKKLMKCILIVSLQITSAALALLRRAWQRCAGEVMLGDEWS